MSSAHLSRLSRRVAGWLVASALLLFALDAAAKGDSCKANFTQSGNSASGLSFATSRTIPGLSPHDALTQYKQIAFDQGYVVGAETYENQGGNLTISQRATASARGFDLHVQADETGKVSISTTLPPGMTATTDAARDDMCGGLDKLRLGATPTSTSSSAAGTAAEATNFVPTQQEITDICVANFMPSLDSVLQGQSFSAWSLGPSLSVPETMDKLKGFVSKTKGLRMDTSAVHGSKATVIIAMDDTAIVGDGGFTLTKDVRGLSLRMDLDSSLGAASFTTRMNKEQEGISQDRVRHLACTLVSLALNGAPLPDEKKSSSGVHLRNPFKSAQKEAAERQTAEQVKLNQSIELMRKAQTLLYQRAQGAGKAIVFMPMLSLDAKYSTMVFTDITPGGPREQEFRFDHTATLVWRSTSDSNNLLDASDQSSLYLSGLFGYIQSVRGEKALYGVYIVDPGSYDLVGLSYDLTRGKLPALSSKRWTDEPKLGAARFVKTQNAEFSSHQYWADARYQHVQVYDGSSCSVMQTGGGVSGCVQWEDEYHSETRMTDAGGWKTAIDKNYVGGLEVALTLAHPFARFDAKAGEVIVTDGFVPSRDSLVVDSDACRQQVSEVADCAIQQLTLFRITGRPAELQLSPNSTAKMPVLARLVSQATYRPMTVNASSQKETAGSYEAGWTTPYAVSTH